MKYLEIEVGEEIGVKVFFVDGGVEVCVGFGD